MSPTCQPRAAYLAEAGDLRLPERLIERLSEIPPEIYVAVFVAGFLGLIFGWFMGRSRKTAALPSRDSLPSSKPSPELNWRHEKLVLLERQEAVRLGRVHDVLGQLSAVEGEEGLRARIFRIAESIREMRRRIGTDYSRFTLVSHQLSECMDSGRPNGALSAALEISNTQRDRLAEMRARFQPLSNSLPILDKHVEELPKDRSAELREALLDLKGKLPELPPEWRGMTGEAERNIRDLLATASEGVEFQALREVLLVDGAETESLSIRDDITRSLRQDVDLALEKLQKKKSSFQLPTDGNPFESNSGTGFVAPAPDSGFRSTPTATPVNGNGNGIAHEGEPAVEQEVSEEDLVPDEGKLVLFRSNDPSIWGTNLYVGRDRRARTVSGVPDWANWISISRTDTGEAVYAPASEISLPDREKNGPCGFHGSNELFYGAHHLGMYSESLPNRVETRFTYGGWGFGHRISQGDPGHRPPQASGWAGEEVSPDTVFEISLHTALPELAENDVVLGQAVAAGHA